MHIKHVCLAVILLSPLVSYTQKIGGKISYHDTIRSVLYLWDTYALEHRVVDSAEVQSDGSFLFNSIQREEGFYLLGIDKDRRVEIILNPTEKMVWVNFSDSNLPNGLEIITSEENKRLWEYKRTSRDLNLEMTKLKQAVLDEQKNPGPKLDSLIAYGNQLQKLKRFQQDQLIMNYPVSFFGRLLASNRPGNNNVGFWANFDFSDPSLLHSSLLPRKITEFLQYHTEYNEDGFLTAVDLVLEKSTANREVYEYSLQFLLHFFEEVGPEVVIEHLIENHFLSDGACFESENLQKHLRTATDIVKIRQGHTIPEVHLNDQKGQLVSLQDAINRSPYSILLFWTSECPHCKEALDFLEQLTLLQRNNSIQLLTIAIESYEGLWMDVVNERKFNVSLHLVELEGWHSDTVKKFNIYRTPTFVIVDKHGKVLAKPIGQEDLISVLEQL